MGTAHRLLRGESPDTDTTDTRSRLTRPTLFTPSLSLALPLSSLSVSSSQPLHRHHIITMAVTTSLIMTQNLPVQPATPLSDEVISLSSLDQQAQRHYPKVLFFFRVDHASSKLKRDALLHNLRRGLALSLNEAPDFAATVVPVPGTTRKELQLQLGPESAVPWKVVDYTTQDTQTDEEGENANAWKYGSYDHLATNHFSITDIPPSLLVDPACLHVPDDAQSAPALTIQVNLLRGGLILAVCWHHTVSDARGLNVLINAWARHTSSSSSSSCASASPAEPEEGARDRWRLNYGPRTATLANLPEYKIDASARSPLTAGSPHLHDRLDPVGKPFVVSTWSFTADALQTLRGVVADAAAETAETGVKQSFTSVEAVSALAWRHLTRARFPSPEEQSAAGTSLFSTRLDFRARLQPPLPATFIGNVCEPNALARLPLSTIITPGPATLATLASAIRAGTEAVTDEVVRAHIGVINTLPGAVTDLTWGYDLFPGPDLGVTDLSALDTMRTDWGVGMGGMPERLRLATRENGLVYIFPGGGEGGLEVQMQCEVGAVERLRGDREWGEFAAFVV
ncbi:transferase family-domain-containing protein [Chaetomium sp. MPI-SDFR-AT-0129]|nr:transferase family-domain-containing protein [Chaetomium sp. MPI-SDFR-AT-0129]